MTRDKYGILSSEIMKPGTGLSLFYWLQRTEMAFCCREKVRGVKNQYRESRVFQARFVNSIWKACDKTEKCSLQKKGW